MVLTSLLIHTVSLCYWCCCRCCCFYIFPAHNKKNQSRSLAKLTLCIATSDRLMWKRNEIWSLLTRFLEDFRISVNAQVHRPLQVHPDVTFRGKWWKVRWAGQIRTRLQSDALEETWQILKGCLELGGQTQLAQDNAFRVTCQAHAWQVHSWIGQEPRLLHFHWEQEAFRKQFPCNIRNISRCPQ